ncbi:exodeoxyribonuclease VII large subunit [Acidocella sp.]|uniref:exodeoxyribonuclease VII large subunit n=1 Tax=Acidocella sp. TaxID=50710 RepID=UPI002616CC78|nr:exodeoxyribonuclease VII large subunit [Acidocella sp.]
MSEIGQNIPEFSVSDIAGAVKRTLEGSFGRVRVRGEITEFKAYGSGHQYFALKDEGAKIRAIIWKFAVPKVGLKAENGVEVIATGKITSYPERSEYQLIVEKLEYAGAGALLARIEALRVRLSQEGLFERKRPLPMLPNVVGVVTSAQGAVLQDIKTTIARRFPRLILLWPVMVQGEGAAEKIAAAINGFNALPEGMPKPDVLIVARGGGSLEDLMVFNDEAVVRAAAASEIPLISAVGHETDTTLIDFAADRRAPTPTAAAEMAVPARLDLLADLAQKASRLEGALARHMTVNGARLERAVARLPDLPAMVGAARQRLDDRGERLELALPGFMAAKRARLERVALASPREAVRLLGARVELLARRLREGLPALLRVAQKRLEGASYRLAHPGAEIAARRAALALRAQRLAAPLPGRLREDRLRLETLAARLEAVSYQRVLARGFALVTRADGGAVTEAASVKPGAALNLRFADGSVAVRADKPRGAQLDLGL